jgi:hypothetical protein
LEHLAATGQLHELMAALEASWLGRTGRQSLWLYPLASVAHIWGVALLFGSVLAFDLRVLGLAPSIPIGAAGRLLLPLAQAGFALQVASGAVMLTADATHVGTSPAFLLKMALVLVALANVAAFHLGPGRRLREWDERAPTAARISAVISMAAWFLVASLGRLIAYL